MPGSGLIQHVRFGRLIAKRWPVVGGVLVVAAVWWSTWQALRPGPRKRALEAFPAPSERERRPSWLINSAVYPVAGSLAGDSNAVPYLNMALNGDSNSVPFLIKALKRDEWIGAAFYRKQVWPRLPSAIQKHLSHLRPHNPDNRLRAAELLGQMGPMAKPAAPALLRMLKEDEKSAVGVYAAWALGRIGRGDIVVTAALAEALKDKRYLVRQAATNALLRIDPEAAAKAGIKGPEP